jgi:hypothetical protein
MLSPYSVAPRVATGVEREGADLLTQEVMARLRGGNPISPISQRPVDVDMGLTDPGIWEQILGYAGAAGGAYGARNRPVMYGQRGSQPLR